jgi:hypothetical protein
MLWNAGFLQSIFDMRDRYFIKLGMRVDCNCAFGSGFGLQGHQWAIRQHAFNPITVGRRARLRSLNMHWMKPHGPWRFHAQQPMPASSLSA